MGFPGFPNILLTQYEFFHAHIYQDFPYAGGSVDELNFFFLEKFKNSPQKDDVILPLLLHIHAVDLRLGHGHAASAKFRHGAHHHDHHAWSQDADDQNASGTEEESDTQAPDHL